MAKKNYALILTSPGKEGGVPAKLDESDKLLNDLQEHVEGNALLEFASAGMALRKGNSTEAVDYCETVFGLCPNFDWAHKNQSRSAQAQCEQEFIRNLSRNG